MTDPNNTPAPRPRWLLPVAAVAVIFGLATIVAGGRVIFGSAAARAAEGDYVPFVLWFNFVAGFAYVAAGVALARGRAWGARLSLAIAVGTTLAYAAFGAHVLLDGAFTRHTVVAMAVRTITWVAIAVLACRHFGCSRAVRPVVATVALTAVLVGVTTCGRPPATVKIHTPEADEPSAAEVADEPSAPEAVEEPSAPGAEPSIPAAETTTPSPEAPTATTAPPTTTTSTPATTTTTPPAKPAPAPTKRRRPAPRMTVTDHKGRVLELPVRGRVTVLSFASRQTADRGSERCRQIRVAHPQVEVVELMNVSSAPSFLAGKVKSKLADRHDAIVADTKRAFAAAKKTPPTDLDARIHIIADWNGDAFKAYGARNTENELQMAVIDGDRRIVTFFATTPTAAKLDAAVVRASGSSTSPP